MCGVKTDPVYLMSACTNYHHCPNPSIIRQIKVHSQITKLSPQYPTRRNSGSATVELKIEKDLRTVTGSELTRIESKNGDQENDRTQLHIQSLTIP